MSSLLHIYGLVGRIVRYNTIESSRAALSASIDDALELDESDYTVNSWTALETVLATAQDVLEDDEATQSEINTARTNLVAAIAALVDLTELEATITEAEALVEAQYTADSWTVFSTALTAAGTVAANAAATQIQVDNAETALADAMEALVSILALETAITAAELLVEEDYTAPTWATFATALAAANTVLADDAATQQEVDDALDALADATTGLVPV